jgi:L-ascorbate metabolism protein UlaG (beta-lactamase superfamily)
LASVISCEPSEDGSAPWEHAEVGGVTITATPAQHGVYEVTFVLRAGSDAVYFAGDTMLIPELADIPKRLGHISLALLPTNGLHIRPAYNMQVVMNAEEAAELTAVLKPELAVPHHYAFTNWSSWRARAGCGITGRVRQVCANCRARSMTSPALRRNWSG